MSPLRKGLPLFNTTDEITTAVAQCCSCRASVGFSLAWFLALSKSFASHVSRVVGDIRRERLHKR